MIVRGTTPVIVFKFKVVDPANISVAYMTMAQAGATVVERQLDTAIIGESTLSWTLTQAETLRIHPRQQVEVQLRYKTLDGGAHGTRIKCISPEQILKDGEI